MPPLITAYSVTNVFTFILFIVELLQRIVTGKALFSIYIFSSLHYCVNHQTNTGMSMEKHVPHGKHVPHTHSEVPLYEAEDDVSADEDAGPAYACAAVHCDGPV